MSKQVKMVGTCALAMAIAGCTQQAAPEFDPLAAQVNQRQRATEVQGLEMRPLSDKLNSPYFDREAVRSEQAMRRYPPPTTGPAGLIEGTIRMPLRELVQRAVLHSRDIRVAGFEPAIEQTRVVESEAAFDPVFFASAQYQRTDELQPNSFGSIFGGGNLVSNERDSFIVGAGVRQQLSSGGRIEASYNTGINDIRGEAGQDFNPNPYYENELVLEITQPLLRNFGSEINRARISVDRNNQRISLLELRQSVEENIFNLEQVYWLLVQAQRDVEILEQLVGENQAMSQHLALRRDQDATEVEVAQAVSSLEQRRSLLVRAKARVRDLSDQIKRLVNDPDLPVSSAVVIVPETAAVRSPLRFEYDEALAAALENRPELAQQLLRLDSARIVERVARNNELPALNLAGTIAAQGLDDDWGGAFENQAEFRNLGWGIGLQFEIPIGNRAAKAITQRSRLQRQQAIEQYQGLIEQVALDLKTAQREIETTWHEMDATTQARLAAARSLELLRIRRVEGQEPLTPSFVQTELNEQANLAQAAQAEAQAVSNYNIAIARFERAKGTLLRYNNILLSESDQVFGTDVIERDEQ